MPWPARSDAVAERSTARGGHEAAAAAWSRASELTADPAVRARRLGAAAHAAWHAAQPARARALADAARPDAAEPLLRADLDRLRARVDWNVGSTLVGHRILLQAARDVAPVDAERARAMTMVAAALVTFVGDGAEDMSAQAATLGDVTAATSDSARCYARLLAGFVHVRNGQFAEAAAQFRPALADCDPRDDTDLRANLGIAAFRPRRRPRCRRLTTRGCSPTPRESGALLMIVHALTRRACGDVAAGDWDALAAGAAEALDLAGRQRPASPDPVPARLAGGAGRAAATSATQLAGHLQAIAALPSAGVTGPLVDDLARWARALTAETPTATLHYLEQMTTPMARLAAGSLPYGHQRLLEIARAFVGRPKLILADEPAAGLNGAEAGQLVGLIRRIQAAGVTMMLVEHHMEVVMRACDRITVLNYGKKLADGSPADIRDHSGVIEAYLGTKRAYRRSAQHGANEACHAAH